MTREEEILEYANTFKGKGMESEELKEIIRLAIIDGATWADENPRKGLVDIEKACEWLATLPMSYLLRKRNCVMTSQELKEKIAMNAASTWCRCFKCDGKVRETGCACEKDTRLTCTHWYHGFRTAILALGDDRLEEYLKLRDSEKKENNQEFEEKDYEPKRIF